MSRLVALAGLVALAACASGGGGNAPDGNGNTGGQPPTFQQWSAAWSGYGGGAFAGPATDGSFAFPAIGQGHADYVLKAGPPRLGQVTITVTGGPFATYQSDAGKDCDNGPTVRLMFAAPGGQDLAGRWWQRTGVPLTPGTHTIPVTDNPADWRDVNGQPGTADPHFAAEFAAAGEFGFSFGDGCAYGHGVSASGPASFSESGV